MDAGRRWRASCAHVWASGEVGSPARIAEGLIRGAWSVQIARGRGIRHASRCAVAAPRGLVPPTRAGRRAADGPRGEPRVRGPGERRHDLPRQDRDQARHGVCQRHPGNGRDRRDLRRRWERHDLRPRCNDLICGGTGNDRIYGGDGNDLIRGGTGNDSISGGSGNDVIYAESAPDGADNMNGGTGTDTLTYASRTGAVRVDLDNVADDGASTEKDNAKSDIENITGGAGADR